eukprot:1159557-Pelagomonas_calceolata.AAC.24
MRSEVSNKIKTRGLLSELHGVFSYNQANAAHAGSALIASPASHTAGGRTPFRFWTACALSEELRGEEWGGGQGGFDF